MGTVYRAEHIHMKKTVAIKILHASHVRDPEVVERFQREAQAAANINHPNICTATDFGRQDEDMYFLVMEYLDGKSLHDAIKAEENFSQLRVINLMKQVCAGLVRAHELGVVHRDLKPENILIVDQDGEPDFVKITDFGVAQVRLFKDAARLTQAGVVYGSPLYMSPEQAGGKEVDHRADLYSVGIMMYELLTGQLPFYAKSLTVVLNMHLSDPPRPFREANPFKTIDPELEEITLRLLAKKREDRFQSAQDLFNALERAEARIAKTGGGASTQKAKTEDDGGSLFKAALTSISVILLGIAIVWGAWSLVDLTPPGQSQPTEEGEAKVDGKKSTAARAKFIEDTEAVQKAIAVGDKKAQDGISEFEKLLKDSPKNPHLRYLGHYYIQADDFNEGFAEYRTAVSLDENYAGDAELLDDVMASFESADNNRYQSAKRFISRHLKSAANQRLGAVAEHHRSRKVRKRALSLLQDTGQFEKLPEWMRLTIELRHATGCDTNRKIIVRIGELGDVRALAALQRFDAKPKNQCNGEDCWECLRGDLRKSIDGLKAKQNQPSMSSDN